MAVSAGEMGRAPMALVASRKRKASSSASFSDSQSRLS